MIKKLFTAIFLLLFSTIQAQLITVDGLALTPTIGAPSNCNTNGYRLIDGATSTGNCAELTQTAFDKAALWVCDGINLNQSFKLNFQAYFGTNNAGGDGIAFLLQTEGVPQMLGGAGGGMGYALGNGAACQGLPCPIAPSIAVEFDTWNNSGTNDASNQCDHSSIQLNGIQTAANALTSPICLNPTDSSVIDGQYHDICISWNVSTLNYQAYFDGNLVADYNGDIRTQFSDPTNVFWGFTAASGGAAQSHQVCNINMLKNIANPMCVCVPPTATSLVTNVSCQGGFDGAIDLTASGSNSPFNFLWSNGDTTEDLNNLSAGTYSLTITDSSGCEITLTENITEPSTSLNSSFSSINLSCNGGSDGVIDLSVSGGISGYTYSWSNGATTEDLNNLSAGNYTVTIVDSNNCNLIDSVLISQPTAISTNIVNTPLSCNGDNSGAIDLSPSGGTAAYSYQWSNTATTQDISGLSAGSYTLTITDANGCSFIDSTLITEPTAFNVSIDSTVDESCQSLGAIYINVSGASPNYSFNWSNGATTEDLSNLNAGIYSLSISDANGCVYQAPGIAINSVGLPIPSINSSTNVACHGDSTAVLDITVSGATAPYTYTWSNGSNTEDLNNIPAGNYSLTVSDANGCTASLTGINITEAAILNNNSSILNINCNGVSNGSIDLTVNGGSPPYSYLWSNAATTQDISGLSTGSYSLTITDANGCNSILNSLIITEPTAINSSSNTTNVDCNGAANGAIDLTVNGGNPPYNYAWSNATNTQNISGLNGGSYTLTITDANGCLNTLGPIVVNEPSAISLNSSFSNPSCNVEDGSISLNPSGGSPAYSIIWDNGSTSLNLSGLNGGSYIVSLTDANNCQISETITLTTPVQPTLNASIENDSMFLSVNPVSINSGNDQTAEGVSYSWSAFGPGNANISNANASQTEVNPDAAGVYNFVLEAISIEGCVASDSVSLIVIEIPEPEIPSAFTPNGDQVNDKFYPIYLDTQYLLDFKVFNRWGEVVYDFQNSSEAKWDGRLNDSEQPSGSYIYVISWQKPNDSEAVTVRGQLTLIR